MQGPFCKKSGPYISGHRGKPGNVFGTWPFNFCLCFLLSFGGLVKTFWLSWQPIILYQVPGMLCATKTRWSLSTKGREGGKEGVKFFKNKNVWRTLQPFIFTEETVNSCHQAGYQSHVVAAVCKLSAGCFSFLLQRPAVSLCPLPTTTSTMIRSNYNTKTKSPTSPIPPSRLLHEGSTPQDESWSPTVGHVDPNL